MKLLGIDLHCKPKDASRPIITSQYMCGKPNMTQLLVF